MLSIIKKYRAWRAAEEGLPPFTPSTLASILSSSCAICGRIINLFSLFGNSIVIRQGAVNVVCLFCRSNGSLPVIHSGENRMPHLSTVDLYETVIALSNLEFEKTEEAITSILGLRTGGGLLQHGEYNKALSPKMGESLQDFMYSGDPIYQGLEYVEPMPDRYGSLLSIRHCGECGIIWNSADDNRTATIEKGGKCYRCGVPNDLQWHMRNTFKTEIESLKQREWP